MDILKIKALDFLKKHGMICESPMGELIDNFIDHMKAGLMGNAKSMLMLPAYIERTGTPRLNEPIIAIDAGGTSFRIALIKLCDDGTAVIEGHANHPMPGTSEMLSWQEFLDALADYIIPYLSKSGRAGFCFSYPMDILENKDGRIIDMTKELKVEGAAGMTVCESLNKTLVKKGYKKIRFTILDDTVAAMFSGLYNAQGKEYDGYIGLILGTGYNTSYFERADEIKKISWQGGEMAVNIEAGAWNGMEQGDFDRDLDNASANPGKQRFEKMVSGAYLGSLILLSLKGAAKNGLFSDGCAQKLRKLESLSMREVNDFCDRPSGSGVLTKAAQNHNDAKLIYYLIEALLERAAKLICANIGAILQKTGKGSEPSRPVCIVAEGTMFYKTHMLRRRLSDYIKCELNDARGLYCNIISVDDAVLIGAAVAGLMN